MAGGVAQGEGLEFKPQYHKRNKNKNQNKLGLFPFKNKKDPD
jgi:hypothetical protein